MSSDERYTRLFDREAFTALGLSGLERNKAIIDAALEGITPPLTVPIAETRIAFGGGALLVEWAALPTPADRDAVVAKIPTIVGLATTSAPVELESLAVTPATSSTLVDVIDHTTAPRDEGTYQICWTSLVGMLATVANAGARAVMTLTRIRGANEVSRVYEHNWDRSQPQTFAGPLTFQCAAGDRIRVRLQIGKIGAPAATAQLSMARVTIDQISAA